MGRKRWSDLSPAYQARLQRHGITASDHAAGATIRHARGHAATGRPFPIFIRQADPDDIEWRASDGWTKRSRSLGGNHANAIKEYLFYARDFDTLFAPFRDVWVYDNDRRFRLETRQDVIDWWLQQGVELPFETLYEWASTGMSTL